MDSTDWLSSRLSDRDLDFLIATVAPEVPSPGRLKAVIREDRDFRSSYIGDQRVFRRIMDDDEVFLKISPALFFEVLLRKAVDDLKGISYTYERSRAMRVPVFDGQEVARFFTDESLLAYLADMLSSFLRVQSYTVSLRIREGIWKKIRFNDMDLHTLMHLCDTVGDDQRLGIYKRIADICLFTLGIFPDYAERSYRYASTGEVRPQFPGTNRISPEEYEEEGQKFYKLAAEHQTAQAAALSEIFWTLHEHFRKAQKPLNFIAEHYLPHHRRGIFSGN